MRKTDHAAPLWGEPLKLLPLLAAYCLYAALRGQPVLRGDEGRYLLNAHNILHGFFASPETLMFWNGPGYPLYLAPFAALKAPLLFPRLGGALFLYLGIVYYQGILRLCGLEKRSLMHAYAMGILLLLHGPGLDMLMTEPLAVFLICGAGYHYFRLVSAPPDRSAWPHLAAAGLHLGYLILTKVFFGYAVEAALLTAISFRVWTWRTDRGRTAAGQAASVCALALALCVPYLSYTYAQTGKLHFWGNSGGCQMYNLTMPEKELLGDWLNFDVVLIYPEYFRTQAPFYGEMSRLDYLSRDEAFRKAALRNLRAHPGKCFRNWRANVNRMVFGFPTTPYPGSEPELATGNRSFIYALPFLLFLLAVPAGWAGRKSIPAAAHACLAFAMISLGGMSLLSCIPRHVFPLLPVIGLWTVLVAEKALALAWRAGERKWEEETAPA